MTNTQAILIGAALIAGSILATSGVHDAKAAYGGGTFELMHHSNTSANAGVFRLNASTGGVSYCYINAQQGLLCTHEVQ
ncbi:MAG: hypothetical protein PHS57_08930 [Alphaproteobacteria bacterium]|nr:hypothetical protein [Alphaproteobacteria bacterium]